MTPLKRNLLVTILALTATMMLTPAVAHAHEEEGPNTGKLHFDLSVTGVTSYYFRGIAQENQDLIVQPDASVTFDLYEGAEGDTLNSISLYIGTWNSIHTGPSGEDGTGDPHYELDFYTGVSVGVAEVWTFDVGYVAYTSPNDLFTTTQEIGLGVEFDDSGLWGDSGFALNPSALIAFETSGGADAGTELGIYLQLGIAPSWDLPTGEDLPLKLTIPVTVGLSLDGDYYESTTDDDFFGYLDIGADLSMPLNFIPSEYGSWEVMAGVHMLVLGDSTEDIAERDFAVDGNANPEIYGIFGLSMSY